jgi:BirA family biotin operon repressor/biotin-[acetyl-CoA-carboxylase] ligase
MMSALASADAMRTTAGLAVGLKWPNDLVVPAAGGQPAAPGRRKLAGLLTETGLAGEQLEYAVVGIGINVNVSKDVLPSLAPDATSLLAEIGRPVDIPTLLGSLLQGVEHRYRLIQEGHSPYSEWAANLTTLGQSVVASTAAGSVAGVAERVDERGALLLRTSDGALRRLTAGDVSLRPEGAFS